MTIEELAALVKEMRDLQKRFFRGERSVVTRAKEVEREVDRAVESVLSPSPQMELFHDN